MDEAVGSSFKSHLWWINVLLFTIYHMVAFCGFYQLVTSQIQGKTLVWAVFILVLSYHGTISGAHRLWSHSTYKANLPLRVFLCFCQTISFERSIIEWVRNHRWHHKSTGDSQGTTKDSIFFYIDFRQKLSPKDVNIEDLQSDGVLKFQDRYYLILAPLCAFVVPVVVPVVVWNEGLFVSWCFAAMFRYLFGLHFAHLWNMDMDNVVTMERNYHQSLDRYYENINTSFIGLMSKIGWAYDLKLVSEDMMKMPEVRTGFKVLMGYLDQYY